MRYHAEFLLQRVLAEIDRIDAIQYANIRRDREIIRLSQEADKLEASLDAESRRRKRAFLELPD